MDMANLFAVNVSPLELVLRGTCIYWFLLLVFRFVLRGDPGPLGVAEKIGQATRLPSARIAAEK